MFSLSIILSNGSNDLFAVSAYPDPADNGVCFGTVITLKILISPKFSFATLIAYFNNLSGSSGVYRIRIL